MKLLHKILLATDFSNSAEEAVEMAIRVAKKFNSEILILHVIPTMEISQLNKEIIEKGVGLELKKTFDKIKAEGVKVHDIGFHMGVPFIRIIQEAEKNNVNVIMMGSGDNAPERSKSVGVTAEKVLHKSAKPVWVVKPGSGEIINKILCPVDFSGPSKRALKNAIHLARKNEAELIVLHAVPSMSELYLRMLGGSEEKQEMKIRDHQKNLDKFLSKFDFHDVNYETIILPGKVDKLILETVKDLEAELIIMGTSGESNNKKILMGSTTEHIIRRLPASIITVKAESVIQPIIDYQISDLQSHFDLGNEFLKNGLPQDAIDQFKYCIDLDMLFASAWEGLAEGYKRIGEIDSADKARQKAVEIRETIWKRKVEAEIRHRHEVVGSK